MSMPPSVKWEYDYSPEKGSKEEELYSKFLIVKDWALKPKCLSNYLEKKG